MTDLERARIRGTLVLMDKFLDRATGEPGPIVERLRRRIEECFGILEPGPSPWSSKEPTQMDHIENARRHAGTE